MSHNKTEPTIKRLLLSKLTRQLTRTPLLCCLIELAHRPQVLWRDPPCELTIVVRSPPPFFAHRVPTANEAESLEQRRSHTIETIEVAKRRRFDVLHCTEQHDVKMFGIVVFADHDLGWLVAIGVFRAGARLHIVTLVSRLER